MAAQTEFQGLSSIFTQEFSSNVELLLQQKESKIRGKVREGSHTGKAASPINQFGEVAARAPTGRFAPLQIQQPDAIRPWVFPQPVEIPQLIDSFDTEETIVSPEGPYAQAAAAALGRAYDDALITASTASRQLGTDTGTLTATSYSTTNFQVASTFGSSSASGLSVAKMIEARRILEHYHNDLEMDPPFMVIGSQQHADLLNQVQVVSTEFNETPVLENGRIRRFLGFELVVSERLSTAASVRTIWCAVKSGMYLGIWKDMVNFADYRHDLSGRPLQLLTQAMYGALRLQDGKVVSILCSDSTGSDITP
jgi:hypothetical protein